MANEAILRTRFSNPVDFTCNETAMEKGTVLKLSGAITVGPCSADGDIFVGVLAREKISGDGRTQVAVYVDGIFDFQVTDAVTAGSQVSISGANVLKVFTAGDSEDGVAFGKTLETASAGDNTIQVMIGRGY